MQMKAVRKFIELLRATRRDEEIGNGASARASRKKEQQREKTGEGEEGEEEGKMRSKQRSVRPKYVCR